MEKITDVNEYNSSIVFDVFLPTWEKLAYEPFEEIEGEMLFRLGFINGFIDKMISLGASDKLNDYKFDFTSKHNLKKHIENWYINTHDHRDFDDGSLYSGMPCIGFVEQIVGPRTKNDGSTPLTNRLRFVLDPKQFTPEQENYFTAFLFEKKLGD